MIVLSRTRRIDWPQIVTDLRRHMSVPEIALALGVAPTAVRSYCDDRNIEPAFWVGSEMLVLWAGRMGRSYTEAPVRTVPLSVAAVLRAG